jgi:mannose-6-phosphate isomerase
VGFGSPEGCVSLLVACRYFATERLEISEPLAARWDVGSFQLLVALSGGGEIRWGQGNAIYAQGECWFVPASLKEYEIVPRGESVFLRTFVPDLDALRGKVRTAGVSDSQIAGVVFE